MRLPEPPLDAALHDHFVATLRTASSVRAACRAAGVPLAAYRRLRDLDPAFAAACAAALDEAATDRLEAALIARATDGVVRVQTFADGRVVQSREYDNRLGLALLQQRRPGRYGSAADQPPPRRPVMSRAEFIAAIRMRPRLDQPEDETSPDG